MRLARWLDDHGGVAQVISARRLTKSYQSYLSQVKGGLSFGSRAARTCEERLGMPALWLDQGAFAGTAPIQDDQSGTRVEVRESSSAVVSPMPRPGLRAALEALCAALSLLREPERRDSVGTLLRACAVAGGDTSYIDAILATMRKHQPPQAAANGTQ